MQGTFQATSASHTQRTPAECRAADVKNSTGVSIANRDRLELVTSCHGSGFQDWIHRINIAVSKLTHVIVTLRQDEENMGQWQKKDQQCSLS